MIQKYIIIVNINCNEMSVTVLVWNNYSIPGICLATEHNPHSYNPITNKIREYSNHLK